MGSRIRRYARHLLMAPHGVLDGLLGLAALVQVAATLPQNYIAFEYPTGHPEWWYDIVTGLPDPIVVDSHIAVWDAPGMGRRFNRPKKRGAICARKTLISLTNNPIADVTYLRRTGRCRGVPCGHPSTRRIQPA